MSAVKTAIMDYAQKHNGEIFHVTPMQVELQGAGFDAKDILGGVDELVTEGKLARTSDAFVKVGQAEATTPPSTGP